MKKNLSVKQKHKIKYNHKPNTCKNYKKKHNNSKKHNSKKQIMSGGRPKVNFPYTYFIIAYSDFVKYYNTLNPYLLGQTNACNNISAGLQPEFKFDQNSSFMNNDSEVCIIVLKYDDAFILNKNLDLLNDFNFLNKILGHSKLTYYRDLSLLGIYNVCLHVFDIGKNLIGNIIYQQKKTKPGYGTVLFNCILTATSFLDIKFDMLWLGIDINNVQFEKVAWLYASKGFENPIFTNILPDGSVVPIYFIQLTSRKQYINNQDDALIPYYDTLDLYNQINTPEGQQGIFSFKFNFDKSAILTLRLMPFLSFSEKKEVIGIENYSHQRESAGIFVNYKSYKDDDDDIINVLSLETISENSLIKFNIGEVGTVFVEGQKIFHTHPFINYTLYNVLIGPPSSQDFIAFLASIIRAIQIPFSNVPQFSAVISIEGIYIFSLSVNGIMLLKNGNIPNILEIGKNYEYQFSNREYNWSTYDNDPTIQVDAVNNETQKYLNWFNSVNNNFGNIIDLIFKPWNDFNQNTQFTIHYYNGNRSKVVTKMDIDDNDI